MISYAEEQPVDIWDIDKKELENKPSLTNITNDDDKKTTTTEFEIFNMQTQKKNNEIELDKNLDSKEIKIFGLYDPQNYGLDVNMWSNSDGDQLKNIFSKLNKINFSSDATEIMK